MISTLSLSSLHLDHIFPFLVSLQLHSPTYICWGRCQRSIQKATLLHSLATCSSYKPSSLSDSPLLFPGVHRPSSHPPWPFLSPAPPAAPSVTPTPSTTQLAPPPTSVNAPSCKLPATSIQPLSCQRCCYLVFLWSKEDSEHGWHSWSDFVADTFGADYFKVRWTFLNNFHHPWNLQEKTNNGHCYWKFLFYYLNVTVFEN